MGNVAKSIVSAKSGTRWKDWNRTKNWISRMAIKLRCDWCQKELGKKRLSIPQKDGTVKMWGFCCLKGDTLKRKPEKMK